MKSHLSVVVLIGVVQNMAYFKTAWFAYVCCETAEKLRISLLQKCVQQYGSSPFQTLIGWVASVQLLFERSVW